jgi:hypothetical protein
LLSDRRDAGPLQQLKAAMLLTILGFLCGILLGCRFDFLILIPAFLLGWLLVAISGMVGGLSWASLLIEIGLVTTALQVGYIGGILGQWMMRSKQAVSKSMTKESSTAADGAF